LKAERAWFLSRMERGAKPETEQALARWDKACVFSKHLTWSMTVISISDFGDYSDI
jgi:hypothetical protein